MAIDVSVPDDYADRIKRVRGRLGLTQQAFAAKLGISFATANRWENAQTKPSRFQWARVETLTGDEVVEKKDLSPVAAGRSPLEFTGNPAGVLALVEGERLSYGHLANPAFATEISEIDPLPHQRIAVYDLMIKRERLRFLLADDAGAGKTIMTGLYVREMLSRRLIRRVLIVAPAGLVGNWQRELSKLFGMAFRIVAGSDARTQNPFVGPAGDRVIVSIDTLTGARVFGRLRESGVAPYDLVVFDEAHKLSADRGPDLYVRPTERYKVAEALAGVKGLDDTWRLPWSTHHLLLLTATPHMGKEYPFFALWKLLEPDVLTTLEAFRDYPRDRRQIHFVRRTKEEMVYLDGRPLYPKRISDTLGYELSKGPVSEQTLYDETTEYLQHVYNNAKILNQSAARLAMTVFQRRLASSTYALLCSFERRIVKLRDIIDCVQDGRMTIDHLTTAQRRLLKDKDDVFEATTADDEAPSDGREGNEVAEDHLLEGIAAASLSELLAEIEQVKALRDLASRVYDAGTESKFERLREVLADPKFGEEKMIIFTEHRDTLVYLVRRLEGMGYTGRVAQIHGGMHYTEREEQVERFRKDGEQGGSRFLVCTDAAGEGINLQFCWIMINFDVPWNPARLEQRMGRIHRYGQKHDPVIILNLVAPKTREGCVLQTLLDKLEKIRKELRSDKVFDVIGRLFQGVSIKQYMEMAIEGRGEDAAKELDGRLTKEQIEALVAKERSLYGTGGDVVAELPRLRETLDQEMYRRLLPGYVRQYVERAAPLVGIEITGDTGGCFTLRSKGGAAVDALLPILETYPERSRGCLSFIRPPADGGIWFHPGEPLFEAFRGVVKNLLAVEALCGGVFVDPAAEKPYLFHLGLVTIARAADGDVPDLAREEILESRLIGVKQFEGSQIQVCPVEHLLLLRGARGLPSGAQRLAANAKGLVGQAAAFLTERIGREMAIKRQQTLLSTLSERESFVLRGFDFQEAELASARAKQSEKARGGNLAAQKELTQIKERQKQVTFRRQEAVAVLRREAELIACRVVCFLAHALVIPSSDPADSEQFDVKTDEIAMALAWAFEESCGALVQDVHTPELARMAGLPENPGFDLLSVRSTGRRSIEVKGRAAGGDVEVTANEWAKACNLRNNYWLYAVYDCATPSPRLVRVQDPFGALLAKAKGSMLIGQREILSAGVE